MEVTATVSGGSQEGAVGVVSSPGRFLRFVS